MGCRLLAEPGWSEWRCWAPVTELLLRFRLAAHPDELVDQLVVIIAEGDATTLGVFPKLFVASEGEPAVGDAERMADEAQGDWNALYLAPGAALRPGVRSRQAYGRASRRWRSSSPGSRSVEPIRLVGHGNVPKEPRRPLM